jgi:hypothetical protein
VGPGKARARMSGAQISGAQISRVSRRYEADGQCSRPFSASWRGPYARGTYGHGTCGHSTAANLSLGIDYAQGIGRVPV